MSGAPVRKVGRLWPLALFLSTCLASLGFLSWWLDTRREHFNRDKRICKHKSFLASSLLTSYWPNPESVREGTPHKHKYWEPWFTGSHQTNSQSTTCDAYKRKVKGLVFKSRFVVSDSLKDTEFNTYYFKLLCSLWKSHIRTLNDMKKDAKCKRKMFENKYLFGYICYTFSHCYSQIIMNNLFFHFLSLYLPKFLQEIHIIL